MGNGGNINIQTGSLFVTNGAGLETSTYGQGDAGSVNINARNTVSFDGVGSNGLISAAISRVQEQAVGNGGDINITTGSLSVTDGARLNASTLGQGDAGSVNINARNTVSFDGVGNGLTTDKDEIVGLPSAVLSTVAQRGVGNAGGINITTGLLSVKNGAELTTSSEGRGAAGGIEVTADSIHLDNQAWLSSDTTEGQGDIILRSGDLVLRHGSNITTNATGTAEGGNITIHTGVIAALENSDISANADEAFGGRVIINAQGIFGTQFREQPTLESDITTSSNLGPQFSGTVEINTPDVDPSQGLVTLPAEVVDASVLIASSRCGAGGRQGKSEFIITGRGGFPFRPRDAYNSYYPTGTVRSIPNSSPSIETPRSSVLGNDPPSNPASSYPTPIMQEAQGWVINDKGEVVLTAQANTATPHNPWMNPPTCRSSTFHQQPLTLGTR